MVSIPQLSNAASEKGAPLGSAILGTGQTSPAATSTFADVLKGTRSSHSSEKTAPGKGGRIASNTDCATANDASQSTNNIVQPSENTKPNAQTVSSTEASAAAVVPPAIPLGANATASLTETSGMEAQSASLTAAQTLDAGIGATGATALPNALATGADEESPAQSTPGGSVPANAPVPDPISMSISPTPLDDNDENATANSPTSAGHDGVGADGTAAKSTAEGVPDNLTSTKAGSNSTNSSGPETNSVLPPQANKKDLLEVGANLTRPAAKQSASTQRDIAVKVDTSVLTPNPAAQLETAVQPSTDGSETVAPIIAAQTSIENAAQVNQAAQKTQPNNRERILQEITSGLQQSLKDMHTTAPAVVAATASNGKLTGSSATPAPDQTAALDSSKQPGNETPGSNPGHSDNSDANGQKPSNLESATAVKAAGQAVVSVDQPLHVPADAPAQPAGSSAGSASRPSPDADASATAKSLLPAFTSLPTSQADAVKASELYQRVGGAEMHISMDTELLGSIDLRTVVHQSTVTATIGVQRSDVQNLLANDLPALQHSLADRNLHVEQISVFDSTIGARTGFGGSSQQQQNTPAPHAFVAGATLGAISTWTEESQSYVNDVSDAGLGAGRLSIHV